MTRHALIGTALLAALATAPAIRAQQQPVAEGPVGPSPYDVVRGWHKPFAEPGFAFGGNSGVFAESPNRIFVAQRGESRLPDPVPPEFAGFAGSIGINVLSAADRRVWRNCLYTLDAQRQRQGALDAVGHAVRGIGRPGTASAAHQPVRPRTPRLGGQRDVPSDLRLLQRRQQAAEDAGREERAGHRRHALRQAAGRGVSARRQDSHRRRPGQPSRDDPRPRR